MPLWLLRLFALAALACVLCAPAGAKTLRITTVPPGATVEIDGVLLGVTPFEKNYPGGYFHRTRTSLGARLEHPLIARLSLPGYATAEITLTEGPMEWISLNGRSHGDYWLLKSDHFDVQLDSIPQTFTGSVITATAPVTVGSPAQDAPPLDLPTLVARAKPAVVYLKALDRSGTGFFVTATGVIATSAHVARDEGTLLAVLADGRRLEGRVVYVDADLDLALVKIPGGGYTPLPLAGPALVRRGEAVAAIGNPGDAMLFSVTRGIVSAIGPLPTAGPGTWIETDAPVNSGNSSSNSPSNSSMNNADDSGGPLLNARGEVIGVNTTKLVRKNGGTGMALSAGDLLAVLRRFYPQLAESAP